MIPVQAFPASYAQARLWFLHQLMPDLTAYHLPGLWRLKGELDAAALDGALSALIERHPTLRTSFRRRGNEVVQIIQPAGPLGLRAEALGERDAEGVIRQWLEEESDKPFDLSAGRLLRARLLAVDRQDHVLMINHHHIASDGWSLSVLSRDLVELYNAHHSGRDPELPALAVHYQDYAAWQRQRLSGRRLVEQQEYWFGQLRDLEPLELPSDRARPAMPSHRGGSVGFTIEPALLEPFEKLCRREGATLQMGLLALVALLLHRYSRQEDVAIGVPIWGRNHPDLENLIGCFINTLPIRTRLEPGLSFRELLLQVRKTSIEAYDHQELPFEQMVEALNLPRDTSRNPLVQVMLQLIELPEASLAQLDGLAVQILPIRNKAANFDLSFYLRRNAEQGLSATITYATDVFNDDRIQRLSTHLITLLSSVLEAPDQPSILLNLLPEPERQLIESWQLGPVVEVPELCVHELFEQQVERNPEAMALVFEELQLNYGELNSRANRLAHHLIDLGVGPDLIVAVCLERSIELMVGLLAILKAGGAYLPLDPAYPEERLAFMVADSTPVALLMHGATREHLEALATVVPMVDLEADAEAWEKIGVTTANPDVLGLRPDHLAYVIYTSGSTGKPKGVMVEHRNLTNHTFWQSRSFQFSPADGVLQRTSLSFDASAWEVWTTLSVGSRLVLLPNDHGRDPQLIIDAIRRQQISIIQVVPSLLQALLNSPSSAQPLKCRHVFCGGEPLAGVLARRAREVFGCDVVNFYGPTEATIDTTWWDCSDASDGEAVPIGRPIANTSISLLDGAGNPVSIGIPGELHIGGAGLARGYLNNPGLTSKQFILDPFSSNSSARFYKTGDLASWNPDGSLAFHGRIDQQIKLRGFRIEPAEIEANLLAHPAVGQAVVVLRKDDPSNLRLIAYWVLEQATRTSPVSDAAGSNAGVPSAKQLRDFLAERLPDYMLPAAFVELKVLPMTTNGKLDRRTLPTPAFAGDLDRRVEPSTELERQLYKFWAEVLGHEDFGITDNFFRIGGDSLLAVHVMERLGKLGLKVEVRDLFATPTLVELASKIYQSETTIPLNLITENTTSLTPELLPLIDLTQADLDKIVATIPGGLASIQDIYALSPLQEGIFFHHRIATAGDPYLTIKYMAFADRALLDRYLGAVQQVMDRHDALRSCILWQGLSTPAQVVLRHVPIILEELELDPAAGAITDQLSRRFDLRHYRLDLSQAPLLRFVASQEMGSGRWIVLSLMHHLITDHVSEQALNAEVMALLACRGHGLPTPFPYRNLIARARFGLGAGEHEAFFRGLLADVEEPSTPFGLEDVLYLDGARFTQARRPVDPGLNRRLRSHARRLGVGVASLFHLAWALVVARTSGQDKAVFGTVLFGRVQVGGDHGMGLYINALPFRLDRDDITIAEAVRLAHQRIADLLRHEHASLALAQRCSGVAAPAPLFSTLLNYRHNIADVTFGAADGVLPGMQSLGGLTRTNYPCQLSIDDSGHSIVLTTKTVEPLDPERVADFMQRALEQLDHGLTEAPNGSLHELDVLPEAERQLIESWQQGPVVEVHDVCVHELFERQVERTPNAVALHFEQQQLTYAELNTRANLVAHHLIDQGVGPELIVAVCLERSVELIVALLAILKAGGAFLPLPTNQPAARLGSILADCGCRFILLSASLDYGYADIISADIKPIQAYRFFDANCPDHNPKANTRSSDLAYVLFTSGTTGKSKAVAVAHSAIANRCSIYAKVWGLDQSSKVLFQTDLWHDSASREWLLPLTCGATVLLASQQDQQDPARLLSLLKSLGCTHLAATPSRLETLIGAASLGPVTVIAGGERLSQELVSRIFATDPKRLLHSYGSTETCLASAFHDLPRPEGRAPGSKSGDRIPFGRPLPNTDLHVLDERCHPCPIGIPGELHIGGAGLARGYLHDPELTAAKFIANPFCFDPSARLYKSGDLAAWNADGTLRFYGRIDQQIKLRGFRIEPGEIEAQLHSHPAVARSVVVLRHDDPEHPRIIAYWVRQNSSAPPTATTQELRSFLAERLPDCMVPSAFVELEDLPLTSTGKIDRRALPASRFSVAPEQRVAPASALEIKLHAHWTEVLGHSDFGIHDNFFQVGGHSLAAVRLIAAIDEQLSICLPIATIFHAPKISLLADLLGRSTVLQEAIDPCFVPLQHEGQAAPLFVIHGYGGDVFCYTDFARALAPTRPVYGLQARGMNGHGDRHRSMQEMAEHYANLIEQHRPDGVVHLLGQSAGGWYAWAVASVLLRRGRSIGMVAILDSGPTAAISARLRASLLVRRTAWRLPTYLHLLQNSKRPNNMLAFMRERQRNLAAHLKRFRMPPAPLPQEDTNEAGAFQDPGTDYFLLLCQRYRPHPQPLRVHLLTSRHDPHLKNHLWRAMACGGVVVRQLFEEHHHFHAASLAVELAAAITQSLEQIEGD